MASRIPVRYIVLAVVFGFVFGVPFIVVGKEYYTMLANLSRLTILGIIALTTGAGFYIEGRLRHEFTGARP